MFTFLNNYHKSWNVLWSSEPYPLGWRTKLQTSTTNITGTEKIGNPMQCTLLWSELSPHLETHRVCSLANRILEEKRDRVMKKSPLSSVPWLWSFTISTIFMWKQDSYRGQQEGSGILSHCFRGSELKTHLTTPTKNLKNLKKLKNKDYS